MSGEVYEDGFAAGVEYATRLVVKRLNEALNEPRSQPSDRAGRITALGLLLQELAPGIDYAAASVPKTAMSDPCPVCGQEDWPAGSAGNARRIHELAEHEGDPRIEPRWYAGGQP